MAFKKPRADADSREASNPYELTDRFHFRDKNHAPRTLHRGSVAFLADEQSHTRAADAVLGDVAYRALVEKDGKIQKITLVFKGQRANDLKNGRLMADVRTAHEARCDAEDFNSPITRQLIVEGAWMPRNWKDASGVWHREWEMLVARWQYTPDGASGLIVEGELPDFGVPA